jgi:hypothetical protein
MANQSYPHLATVPSANAHIADSGFSLHKS